MPQGISADIIATQYGFTRDMADALAVENQRRAAQAWAERRFAKSVVTVIDQNGLTILDPTNTCPRRPTCRRWRAETRLQGMGEMMPGFDKVAMMKYPHLERIDHIHHAGNSSGIVDGAAAVLIGNREFGVKQACNPAPAFAQPPRSAPIPRSC